jgi:hypothetical protein
MDEMKARFVKKQNTISFSAPWQQRAISGLTVSWEYGTLADMKTTMDIPDDLFRTAKSHAALTGAKLKDLLAEGLRQVLASSQASTTAPPHSSIPKRKRPSHPPVPARRKGKLSITNEIIAELDDENLLRRAFGGHYRLRHAPVKVSEGNEIRPLTNEELARLFEPEETLRPQ